MKDKKDGEISSTKKRGKSNQNKRRKKETRGR